MKHNLRDEPKEQTHSRPWWVYFLYAGTGVLGRVLSTRFSINSANGRRIPAGIVVNKEDGLKPGLNPEIITATTLIGQRIEGSDGKELGKIEEVAMDLTQGAISYFVLSSGGILGIGDKFYAVPLTALTLKPEKKSFYLYMNKKELKRMPEIDKHNWPRKAVWPLIRSGHD